MAAGIDMRHVPYKGASPAMTSTMGGETQLTITTTVVATPLVKSGRLRATGVLPPRSVSSPSDALDGACGIHVSTA
jgi:tripartite-type tricarboxylate transporter receptor subunit TctC